MAGQIPRVGRKTVPTQPIPVRVNGYMLHLSVTTPRYALESIKIALIRFCENLKQKFAKDGGKSEVYNTPDDCPGLTVQATKIENGLVRIMARYDGDVIANEVIKLT